jgi:hypothetical protein
MVGNWFGRFLASNDLEKFETIRQTYCKRLFFYRKNKNTKKLILVENEQKTATNVCDIFDIYTNNGDSRLTFLCQIRPTHERRSKSIKYSIVAQLIE